MLYDTVFFEMIGSYSFASDIQGCINNLELLMIVLLAHSDLFWDDIREDFDTTECSYLVFQISRPQVFDFRAFSFEVNVMKNVFKLK